MSPITLATASFTRKRSSNERLIAQSKTNTSHLSATLDEPLTSNVDQQQVDAAAVFWNAVHASVGSFADEHSTL